MDSVNIYNCLMNLLQFSHNILFLQNNDDEQQDGQIHETSPSSIIIIDTNELLDAQDEKSDEKSDAVQDSEFLTFASNHVISNVGELCHKYKNVNI